MPSYGEQVVYLNGQLIEKQAEIERLRSALAPFVAAAKNMQATRELEPKPQSIWSSIWAADDGSCGLSVADFQRAAAEDTL